MAKQSSTLQLAQADLSELIHFQVFFIELEHIHYSFRFSAM